MGAVHLSGIGIVRVPLIAASITPAEIVAQQNLARTLDHQYWLAIFTAAVVIVVVIVSCGIWKWWVAPLKDRSRFLVFLSAFEVLCAVTLGVVGTVTDLWKVSTWDNRVWWSLPSWSATLAIYVAVKVLTYKAKDVDASKIRDLQSKLDEATASAEAWKRKHALCMDIIHFARSFVAEKLLRLAGVLNSGQTPKPDGILEKMSPKSQITLVLSGIHAFFSRGLQADKRLRLALYVVDKQKQKLVSAFEWDGKNPKCFSGKSDSYMGLNDPTGTRAVVVKCYQERDGFILIEDCAKAEKEGRYKYLHERQEGQHSSMLAFKHVIEAAGHCEGLVLSLVSSQTGLFREEDREEIRQFLLEMMTRLGYEWVVLSTCNKQKPPRKRNQGNGPERTPKRPLEQQPSAAIGIEGPRAGGVGSEGVERRDRGGNGASGG